MNEELFDTLEPLTEIVEPPETIVEAPRPLVPKRIIVKFKVVDERDNSKG